MLTFRMNNDLKKETKRPLETRDWKILHARNGLRLARRLCLVQARIRVLRNNVDVLQMLPSYQRGMGKSRLLPVLLKSGSGRPGT
jgi:hypothetical protein